MPEKPEVIPDDGLVNAVLDQIVDRLIKQAAADIGHPLAALAVLVKDGHSVKAVRELATGEGKCQQGELHLRFRATSTPDRYLFFVDSVFDADERAPSFSGFMARGDLRTGKEEVTAHASTWTVKWNEREWTKWL
jgi:hypothetical protein